MCDQDQEHGLSRRPARASHAPAGQAMYKLQWPELRSEPSARTEEQRLSKEQRGRLLVVFVGGG